MTEATERIGAIIDDADRQAGQIIMNAEVEARRFVESVRQRTDREAEEYAQAMAALSEALISQAEVLSRESQRLLAGLEAGGSRVFDEDAAPGDRSEGFMEPADEFSAGARLLATQMAVAGSSRNDIHDRLVNDFGIAHPGSLLDSILGPG